MKNQVQGTHQSQSVGHLTHRLQCLVFIFFDGLIADSQVDTRLFITKKILEPGSICNKHARLTPPLLFEYGLSHPQSPVGSSNLPHRSAVLALVILAKGDKNTT
jgi:hypothetical protein